MFNKILNLDFSTNRDYVFKETKEIDYLLVPKYYYVTFLVENNYNIVYHFTDIKKYYPIRDISNG